MSAPPTLTRHEKQQQTRRALLEAAVELFGERGLEGASVDDIAQAAGYTKGAFYANFKSKEELFLVILDEHFGKELERLDQALAGTDEPQEEARAAAAGFMRRSSSDEWPSLWFQFVAHAARNEEFRQELATRHKAMRGMLAEVFQRWKEGFGVAPPLPFDQITAMVIFMADGFLVDRIVEPDLNEELYPTMVSIFLRGLQSLAEEPAS